MLAALYHRDNDISRLYLIFLVKSLDLCLSIQINFVFQELRFPLKEWVCSLVAEGHLVYSFWSTDWEVAPHTKSNGFLCKEEIDDELEQRYLFSKYRHEPLKSR